jgi:predicted ATPase
MIQIDKIEIKHFRSINRVRVDTSKDVIILSGRNDVGKSNVLKAMNLFFNDETDWRTPLHFTNDFSQTRLQEVRKKTIKGRQFIQVSIRFIRGDHYQKSLPDKFTVTRTWYRDTARQETNSLKTSQDAGKLPTKSLSRANAALQRYLHQIKFEYVPAIKDKLFFSYLLGAIQDVIVERKPGESALADNITSLNDLIKAETELLQQEFTRVSGISASINMPEGLDALFRAANVRTNRGELLVPLDLRGDGIRSRFLPSLLNYIAQSSKLSYIWGFEEPENSLEYLRTSELADKIVTEYAGNVQIFITSHSPSFFSRQDKNVAVYRVFSNNTDTDLFPVFPPQKNTNVTLTALENELGFMEFQKKYHEQFEKRINALAKQEEIHKELELKLQDLKMPVLVTEGYPVLYN